MNPAPASPSIDPLTREGLTADAVRKSIRKINPHIHVWSDDELDASLDATLAQAPNRRHVWVFAYGSLPWNPLIDVVSHRPGIVHGYRRRFCMIAPTGRGTPDNPGLIFALDTSGSCHGVALKVNPKKIRDELALLWRREMVVGSYTPRWVRVRGQVNDCAAIAFVMNRTHSSYRGTWSPQKTARTVATASGVLGSNADYLFDTLDHLHDQGLNDHGLTDLTSRVKRIQNRKPKG